MITECMQNLQKIISYLETLYLRSMRKQKPIHLKNEGIKVIMITEEQFDYLSDGIEKINERLDQLSNASHSKDEYLTSTEARKLLGVSQKTWQTYRDERRIPFSQFGRKIYVKRSDIEEFISSHKIHCR